MDTTDPARLVSWLYLDMNSFYASVEQEMAPYLRGRPVAVVPLAADTTCCIAVSYEGKAFGVKTGTAVYEARKLCPAMKFIVGDHRNYIQYHNKIVEAVEACVPVDAVCSIDEIACRLTGSQREPAAAEALAAGIKARIKSAVGSSLRCSIGVAPNRFLAKIASDIHKPDGFTAILPRELPQALYRLKLKDIPGIGSRMEARLNREGITSMEQLCSMCPKEMQRAWNSVCGEELWHLLRGEDVPAKLAAKKSIGHSHVLPPELRHEAGALKVMLKLTAKSALRLRKQGYYASGVHVFVEFMDRPPWKARLGLLETQDTLDFISAVRNLWKGLPAGRILAEGVVLTGLVPETERAPALFDDNRKSRLVKTLDQLNVKYGKDVVHCGATHETEGLVPLRISFTNIPDPGEV